MMKEPNWTCKKCGLKLRLPATQLESPTFKCLCAKPKRQPGGDNGIPCAFRGKSVEKINCGCSGIEYTWQCNNPAVESEVCTLRRLPKMPAEIKALPCCLCCESRSPLSIEPAVDVPDE